MSDFRKTVEAIWRREASRVIAALTHGVRDLGLAEDLAQDALVMALKTWPEQEVPDHPGAWLLATAKISQVKNGPVWPRSGRGPVSGQTRL